MIYIKLSIITILLGILSVQPTMAQQSLNKQDSLFKRKVSEFRKLQNVEAQEQLYMSLKKNFDMESSEQIRRQYNYLHSALAIAWLSEGNLDKYEMYKGKTDGLNLLLFLLNDELEKMAEEGKNLEAAVSVAQSLLDTLAVQREMGTEGYSSTMHGLILHKSALVQYKLGNNGKALEYIGKADEMLERKHPGFINQHATILSANGKYQQALDVLSAAVKEGTFNEASTNLLRSTYVELHGDMEGYEPFMASLNEAALQKASEEVKKKRVDPKPAPKWTLTDLNGKSVSLADLKGHIVVMDFWATWCGPCKSSFPGMQQAVDAYADDPKVTFVFVSVGEEKETVQDYIDESGYRFHVLLDKDKKVAKDYGVRGIPAKIVIGPKGRLLFNSVGYSGSQGSTFNNMKAMIELIKKD